MASAGFLLAPKTDPGASDELTGERWKAELSRLTEYRGGFRRLEEPPGAATEAFVSNRGARDEFNFDEFPHGDELARLRDMAGTFPGAYLAAWTFGHVFALRTFVSGSGEIAAREFAFRIEADPSMRPPEKANLCADALLELPFEIDRESLFADLNQPKLPIGKLFATLGLPGAKDEETAHTEGLWHQFDTAAQALLGGKPIDEKSVAGVNAAIATIEPDDVLTFTPEKSPGQTSRRIEEARYSLKESIGEPQSQLWQERCRAARFYWDITDCEDASSRLTFGSDEDRGWGESAAIGRLIGHYPQSLMRDSLFFASASLEAESANGHCYVAGLALLAESCTTAGFTLAVFPTDLQAAFWEHFGIGAFEENPIVLDPDWSAEAFIDLSPQKDDNGVTAEIARWFASQATTGVLLRATADGKTSLRCFANGGDSPVSDVLGDFEIDGEKLSAAASSLWPRGCFSPLGLPDFLEPGEWHEGAYSGETSDEHQQYLCDTRKRALEIFTASSEPERVANFDALGQLPAERLNCDGDDSELFLSVELPPTAPSSLADDLCADLANKGVIAGYGEQWVAAPNQLLAYTRTSFASPIFVRTLTDLPAQTRLRLSHGDGEFVDLILDGNSVGKWGHIASFGRGEDLDDDDDDELSDEEVLAEADALMGLFGEKFAPLLPLHPDLSMIEVDCPLVTEIVFKNGDRQFYRLDLSSEKVGPEEKLGACCKAFESAGFTVLGDTACNQFGNVIMRGFAHPDRLCYGTIMMPLMGPPILECYSAIDGGLSLTTTTNQQPAPDNSEHGAYKQTAPESATPDELLGLHLATVAEIESEGRDIVRVEPSLAGFAKAVDEFLTRTLGH